MDQHTNDQVARFASLFAGAIDAFGQSEVTDEVDAKGKRVTKSFLKKQPLEERHYADHLAGVRSIGIQLLNEDDLCCFGAIDVDDYSADRKALYGRAKELELPLILCRSKSGGTHAFLFLNKPTDPTLVRPYLQACVAALGLPPTTEVFPKQDKRGKDGFASWINLPYFDVGDMCLRFAVDENDEAIELNAFLQQAEDARVDASLLVAPAIPPSALPAPSRRQKESFKLPERIEENRNVTLFHYACQLQEFGWTNDDIKAELIRVNKEVCVIPLSSHLHEEGWEPRAYRLKDDELGWIFDQATKYPKGEAVPSWMRQLNEGHAVVVIKGKTVVMNTNDIDPQLERRVISYSSFQDFKNAYLNRYVPVGKEGKKAPAGAAWLAHPQRRQYSGATFLPGKTVPDGWYNMWSGFSFEPNERGDWSLLKEHMLVNLCRGNVVYFKYLLGWMAFTIQCPSIVPEVAIVLLGGRGTGKSIFANTLGALMREHYVSVSNQEHVSGRFNAHLADTLLLFLDEAMWAGDKKGEGTLKRLITDKYIPVEKKRIDVGMQRNYCHLIVAANADWAIPAGLDERRFFVLNVSDAQKQNHEYFGAIQRQMDEEDGYAGMLHELKSLDLTGFNPRAAPMTEALYEQKIHSMDKRQSWWFECLMDGRIHVPKGVPSAQQGDGWPIEVSKEELHQSFLAHAGQSSSKQHSGSSLQLAIFLTKVLPEGWLRKDGPNNKRNIAVTSSFVGRDGEDKEAVQLVNGYVLPPLEAARGSWDKQMRGETPWPEDDSPPF